MTLKQFVDYKKLLDEEAKSYRDFIQTFSIFGGAATLIFGAILAWMNWKTRSDVQIEVQKQLESIVKKEIERQFPGLEKNISAAVEDITRRMGLLEEDAKHHYEEHKNNLEGIVRDANARRAEINRMIVEISGSIRLFRSVRPEIDDEAPSLVSDNVRLLNILWVDDAPSNNAYPVNVLRSMGARITQVLSTNDAFDELVENSKASYNLIISDMGRGADYTAGLSLLRELRYRKFNTAYIIFCSARGEVEHKIEAANLGALAITSSTTTLFGEVTKVANSITA